MAVKRSTKPKKAPSLAVEKTSPPAEDRVTVVTEVVEVVDGVEEKDNTLVTQAQKTEEVIDSETLPQEATSADKTSVSESGEKLEFSPAPAAPPQGEKRKEVVEELFKVKEPVLTPEISMHRNDSSLQIVKWAVGVVVAAIVIGLTLLLIRGGVPRLPGFSKKPLPTPTPIVTPTPAAPKREDLAIQVLNGGGKPGAASKMKEFLEGKGYKVTNLGNTDEYTYQKTNILVKASKSAYLSLLEEDLKESYAIGTAAASLSSDAAYDAQVIVGNK